MKASLPLWVALVTALSSQVVAQIRSTTGAAGPEAQFRAEIGVVEVDLHVTDASGRPVTDLRRDEVEIFEEGRRGEITSFEQIQRPSPRPPLSPSAAPPDTGSASADAAGEGHPYIIVLDDLHVARSNTPKVKRAVRDFVARALRDGDRAALVFTGGHQGQPFTASRDRLAAAIDGFAGTKLRSATAERLDDPRLNLGGVVAANADPFAAERAHRAQTTMATLRQAAADFGGAGRRTTLLFVSEGLDFEVSESTRAQRSTQWSTNAELRDTIGGLNRANVAVYTLDPRGVTTGTEELIQSSSIFEQQNVGARAARRQAEQSLGTLYVLSANTGGETLLWKNDMTAAFDRIVRDASSYYLLRYASPAPGGGRGYRRIEVRVSRPGVRVRARDGYLAG